MILSSLYIADSPGRGRGVFTMDALAAGTIIEVSPVIVLSREERILLDQTQLHDYIFIWGKQETECCVALGYLSLYNHDYRSNAEYEMYFDLRTIRVTTVQDVNKGTEICINYNGNWNNAGPVWFDRKSGTGE